MPNIFTEITQQLEANPPTVSEAPEQSNNDVMLDQFESFIVASVSKVQRLFTNRSIHEGLKKALHEELATTDIQSALGRFSSIFRENRNEATSKEMVAQQDAVRAFFCYAIGCSSSVHAARLRLRFDALLVTGLQNFTSQWIGGDTTLLPEAEFNKDNSEDQARVKLSAQLRVLCSLRSSMQQHLFILFQETVLILARELYDTFRAEHNVSDNKSFRSISRQVTRFTSYLMNNKGGE